MITVSLELAPQINGGPTRTLREAISLPVLPNVGEAFDVDGPDGEPSAKYTVAARGFNLKADGELVAGLLLMTPQQFAYFRAHQLAAKQT